MLHILLTLFYTPPLTIHELSRVIVLITVAYVIGLISEEHAKGEKEIIKEKRFSGNIIATVPDSLLVLDRDLRIKSANRTFYEKFQIQPEKVN